MDYGTIEDAPSQNEDTHLPSTRSVSSGGRGYRAVSVLVILSAILGVSLTITLRKQSPMGDSVKLSSDIGPPAWVVDNEQTNQRKNSHVRTSNEFEATGSALPSQRVKQMDVPHDINAFSQTRTLLTALWELKDKQRILFGHQEDNVHGQIWQDRTGSKPYRSDIFNWTGSYPAVFGYAFQARGKDDFDYLAEARYAYEEQGAIITFLWAAYNPITGGQETNLTKNVCREVVPGGTVNAQWKEWMNQVGDAFNNLTDSTGSKIPVIFRPFHEVTGSWYWWGKEWCNSSDYIKMWKYTQEYLREKKQVHNLLYVYAPASPSDKWEDAYEDYYPGDDVVDIIGFDRYADQASYPEKLLADCQAVAHFARQHNKISAIAETGITDGIQYVTDPNWFIDNFTNIIMQDERGLCQDMVYSLTWKNTHKKDYWVPVGGETTWPGFKEMVHSEYVLFANDPGWIRVRNQFGYSPLALVPSPEPTSEPSYSHRPTTPTLMPTAEPPTTNPTILTPTYQPTYSPSSSSPSYQPTVTPSEDYTTPSYTPTIVGYEKTRHPTADSDAKTGSTRTRAPTRSDVSGELSPRTRAPTGIYALSERTRRPTKSPTGLTVRP